MLRCANDDSFGPTLGPGSACAAFDFTVLFEELFLIIIPCTIALLLIPFRLSSLWRRPRLIEWSLVRGEKLVLNPPGSV